MAAALYWWRASRRAAWRPTLIVVLICGILGAVSLAALAGARRTESAYGRYLTSINASTVSVNIPEGGTPGAALMAKVSDLRGIRSSADWLGFDANPVVHGHVDDSFVTDGLARKPQGRVHHAGPGDRAARVGCPTPTPPMRSPSPRVWPSSSGSAWEATSPTSTRTPKRSKSVVDGYATYRVVGIVEQPPVLVDQFDQTQGAVLPQAAAEAADGRASRAPSPSRGSGCG